MIHCTINLFYPPLSTSTIEKVVLKLEEYLTRNWMMLFESKKIKLAGHNVNSWKLCTLGGRVPFLWGSGVENGVENGVTCKFAL